MQHASLLQEGGGAGLVPHRPRRAGLLERDGRLDRETAADVAGPFDVVEQANGGVVVVGALDEHFDAGETGEDATRVVAPERELVGGPQGVFGQLVGPPQLAGARRDVRGEGRVAHVVGDPAVHGPGQRLVEHRGRPWEVAGLDEGSGHRHREQRQQALAGWPPVQRDQCPLLVAQRRQRLPAMLAVLAPGAFDEREERALGVRVGLANPLQPRRRILGAAERDQPDQELQERVRIGVDGHLTELVQPQPDRLHGDAGAVGEAHGAGGRLDQDLPGPLGVADRHHVLQRAGDVAAFLQHPARPVVGGVQPRRAQRREAGAQEGGEQMVVAVRTGPIIERDHEEVGREQAVEHQRGVVQARHGGTELRVEGLEHGGGEEELDHVPGEAGQHLAEEEVAHRAIGAGERGDEVVAPGSALEGDRGQLDTGRPSLGELVEPDPLVHRQGDAVESEEGRHLAVSEAQVVAAHLQQIPADPPSGQRQRRIRSRPDDDPKAFGQRTDERGEQRRVRVGEMEVVDDEDAARHRRQLVGHGDGGVVRVGAVALQQHEGVVGDPWPHRRQRREQAAHEPRRFDVRRIAREPRQRPGDRRRP